MNGKYLVELPAQLQEIFNVKKILKQEHNFKNRFIKSFDYHLCFLKYNQFVFEIFLLFYNIETYDLEAYDELYESFFKRLMIHWISVLPLDLESVQLEIKLSFKKELFNLLKDDDHLSLFKLYKKWLKLWDCWIIKHRLAFLEHLSSKFELN